MQTNTNTNDINKTLATAMVDTETLIEAAERACGWQEEYLTCQAVRITWHNGLMHIIAHMPAMDVGYSWDARTASTGGDAVIYVDRLRSAVQYLRDFGDEHTLITQSVHKFQYPLRANDA